MSGIPGIFHIDRTDVDRTKLVRMADSLRNRGPDGMNFFSVLKHGCATRKHYRKKKPMQGTPGLYVQNQRRDIRVAVPPCAEANHKF